MDARVGDATVRPTGVRSAPITRPWPRSACSADGRPLAVWRHVSVDQGPDWLDRPRDITQDLDSYVLVGFLE
jgi:hypothetical protein